MNKQGFTLSEMMVAMAVLGILLAIVIPTIVNTRPDEHKMLTKKAYYVTEQVVNSLINDELLYPDSTMNCPQVTGGDTCYYGFDDTSAVTYNGTTYGGAGNAAKTKFPLLFAEQVNVKSLTCGGTVTGDDGSTTENNACKITTSDGITFDFAYNNSTYGKGPFNTVWTAGTAPASNKRVLLIDVNGDSSPNCLQTDSNCNWPDQFRIEIQSNGRMNVLEEDTIAAKNVTFDTKVFEN